MFVDYSWPTLTHSRSCYDNHDSRQLTGKRKSALTRNKAREKLLAYPSPPMSNPPSPARQPPEILTTSTSGGQHIPATTSATQARSGPPAFYEQITSAPTSLGAPAILAQGSNEASSQSPSAPMLASAGPGTALFATPQFGYPTTSTAAVESTSARSGRKSKTHVASACVNCKRAHLSCDVQRPCARCVASGKQESCFDVAHKKRGRPRLRDESDFRLDRTVPPAKSMPTVSSAPLTTPTRPIAATRQRRAESFRSIQSMTSEGSSGYGPPTPGFVPQPPPHFQAALTYQQPAPPPGMIPQTPTAFLDLDFKVLRVNRSFQQIMSGGRDLTGLRLTDIAAPADSESFVTIRNRIRAERESREPSYLPPILSTGEDPLGGVTEANVEQFTQGFADRTYMWTQMQAVPGGAQVFPARVRLARAGTYFTVVTLPSFRPVEFPPPIQMPYGQHSGMPFALGPPLNQTEGYNVPQRQTMPSPAPLSAYPYESTGPPMQRQAEQGRMLPTYPQPQPPPPYPPPPPAFQQSTHSYPQYHSTSFARARLPAAEPPSQAPPFTPMTAHREFGPLPGAGINLPPIGVSPSAAAASGTVAGPSGETSRGQRSSSSEGSQGPRTQSPRKRRRMGIDEVLQ